MQVLRHTSILLFLLLFTACTQVPETQAEKLYSLMEGTFSSEDQSKKNSKYYNVTLQLAHIWEERQGNWVYAEWGLTNTPEAPYSIRIFNILEPSGNTVEMVSYELKDPEEFIGKWKEPSAFDAMTVDDLELREGCSVFFKEIEENSFLGTTKGNNCSRGLGKADYSTHQLRISEDQVMNWARGYDKDDSLVWGISEGGYILEQIEEE